MPAAGRLRSVPDGISLGASRRRTVDATVIATPGDDALDAFVVLHPPPAASVGEGHQPDDELGAGCCPPSAVTLQPAARITKSTTAMRIGRTTDHARFDVPER
jgi:hypothetical protein